MLQSNDCRCDARSLEFEYVSWRNQLTSIYLLLIWETGWTFGCVMLILQAIAKNELPLWLFAFVFILTWFFVLGVLLNLLFGRQTGKLDRDGFFFHRRIICITVEKTIPLADLIGFRLQKEVSHSSKGGTSTIWFVELQTTERSLRIAAQNIKSDLHDWLVENGNSVLKTLQRDQAGNPERVAHAERVVHSEDAQNETISLQTFRNLEQESSANPDNIVNNSSLNEIQRFVQSDANLADESDADPETVANREELYTLDDPVPSFRQSKLSRWTKTDEFSELDFTSRGRFQFDSMLVTLFVCLFWNGGVSLFLYLLFFDNNSGIVWRQTSFTWLNNLIVSLFFTPFILIGLFLLWLVLSQALEPVTFRKITFTRTEVRKRTSVLGIPYSRRFNVESVAAFEINDSGKHNQTKDSCQLIFLNDNGDALGKINNLTLGDARWLMVEFRHLFGK